MVDRRERNRAIATHVVTAVLVLLAAACSEGRDDDDRQRSPADDAISHSPQSTRSTIQCKKSIGHQGAPGKDSTIIAGSPRFPLRIVVPFRLHP